MDHTLVHVGECEDGRGACLSVHFTGKNRTIEPVDKNNIREVLEFETGHLAGVFEEELPEYGLTNCPTYRPFARPRRGHFVTDQMACRWGGKGAQGRARAGVLAAAGCLKAEQQRGPPGGLRHRRVRTERLG
ncbi:hypothetical protein [Streptomyces malaysiensis]|uniref:hypothetical protein n=1 Tax=Streptomyces malaysiensis TaxID=92644 RepID=UPI002B2C4053|nr:hypothetical protein R8789_00810 [Streptomyces malaysiensis]